MISGAVTTFLWAFILPPVKTSLYFYRYDSTILDKAEGKPVVVSTPDIIQNVENGTYDNCSVVFSNLTFFINIRATFFYRCGRRNIVGGRSYRVFRRICFSHFENYDSRHFRLADTV